MVVGKNILAGTVDLSQHGSINRTELEAEATDVEPCWVFTGGYMQAGGIDGKTLSEPQQLRCRAPPGWRFKLRRGGDAGKGGRLTSRVLSPSSDLHNVFVSHSNSWCGTVGDSVTVLEGDNLQLQCSADASQAPQYEWIREVRDQEQDFSTEQNRITGGTSEVF